MLRIRSIARSFNTYRSVALRVAQLRCHASDATGCNESPRSKGNGSAAYHQFEKILDDEDEERFSTDGNDELMEKIKMDAKKLKFDLADLGVQKKYDEVLELFYKEKERGEIPLYRTHYAIVFQILGMRSNKKSIDFFVEALNDGVEFTLSDVARCLHLASLEKNAQIALSVWNYMKQRWPFPPVRAYSSLIDMGHALGDYDLVISLFQDFYKESQPPSYLYLSYLKALYAKGKKDECIKIIENMRLEGIPIPTIIHQLHLSALASNDLNDAWPVFVEALQNIGSYSNVHFFMHFLTLCNEQNNLHFTMETISLYEKMEMEIIYPFIALALKTLLKLDALQQAKYYLLKYCDKVGLKLPIEILDQFVSLERYYSVQTIVEKFQTLLKAELRTYLVEYFKNMDTLDKPKTLRLLKAFDVILKDKAAKAYWRSTVIRIYTIMGNIADSSLIMKQAMEDKQKLDIQAYNHYFNLCSSAGESDLILQVFEYFLSKRMKPTGKMYWYMRRLTTDKYFVDEIKAVYLKFKEKGVNPPSSFHVLLMNIFCKVNSADEALVHFNELIAKEGFVPSYHIFRRLSLDLLSANRVQDTINILQRLVEYRQMKGEWLERFEAFKRDPYDSNAVERMKKILVLQLDYAPLQYNK